MAVSSSFWDPLRRLPKMSSPSCSRREGVSSWAGSQSPTAMWHKPWTQLPTTPCQSLTRRSAPSTSSLTPKGHTSPQWSDEARYGQLPPPGLSTASQPSGSFLYQTLKNWTENFFYTLKGDAMLSLILFMIIMAVIFSLRWHGAHKQLKQLCCCC